MTKKIFQFFLWVDMATTIHHVIESFIIKITRKIDEIPSIGLVKEILFEVDRLIVEEHPTKTKPTLSTLASNEL